MKDFDAKWQSSAARARQTPPRDESLPAGFTTRVVAGAAAAGLNPLTEVWQVLVVRLLAGSVGLLLVCAAVELPHFRETKPLEPGIENTVAQLVWSL